MHAPAAPATLRRFRAVFALSLLLTGLSTCIAAEQLDALATAQWTDNSAEQLMRSRRDLGLCAPDTQAPAVQALLKQGGAAIPILVQGLADRRPLTMAPILADGRPLDFTANHDRHRLGTIKQHPIAVPAQGEKYQLTVADACAAILGQLTNRDLAPLKRRASGSLSINSMTNSPQFHKALAQEWSAIDKLSWRQGLVRDFLEPDRPERRWGAYWRLAHYEPAELGPAVLAIFTEAVCDMRAVEIFVRGQLYRQTTSEDRRESLHAFLLVHGPRYRDAVQEHLFDDLALYEATPDKAKQLGFEEQPKRCLQACYAFGPSVSSLTRPRLQVTTMEDRIRLVARMTADSNAMVTRQIEKLFNKHSNHDRLALACMRRLVLHGNLGTLRAQCLRRGPLAGNWRRHYQAYQAIIDQALKEQRRPRLSELPPFR